MCSPIRCLLYFECEMCPMGSWIEPLIPNWRHYFGKLWNFGRSDFAEEMFTGGAPGGFVDWPDFRSSLYFLTAGTRWVVVTLLLLHISTTILSLMRRIAFLLKLLGKTINPSFCKLLLDFYLVMTMRKYRIKGEIWGVWRPKKKIQVIIITISQYHMDSWC